MREETIAAIATPHGEGGIGVIRISGEDAFGVAGAVFRSTSGKVPAKMPGYTAAYGGVFDADGKIDEAVLLVFHAPKSYTGEDVAELSCHGGEAVLSRALSAAFAAGARLAEPGEFTKRAFLNGRIGLTEAEAVMELIEAKSKDEASAALARREGALHRRVARVKEELYGLCAEMAAYFDYPDEDEPSLSPAALLEKIRSVGEKLDALCGSYEQGKVLRDGVPAVIAGKPNVGKSTLMNRILGEDRSIVTSVAGTTRDVVEESARFAGTTLRLSDTAGLRETNDPVERIGVGRARKKLSAAALVFAVFDRSRPLDAEDEELIASLKGRPAVAVLNKADLPSRCDEARIRAHFPHTVALSAADASGLDELEACVKQMLQKEKPDPRAGILANARQLDCAQRAKRAMAESKKALDEGYTLDAVSVGLRDAADALAELTGEQASEEVVSRVFARFCVGK